MKSAGVLDGRQGRSPRHRYSPRAVTVLGCSGNLRDLPNLPLRMVSVPSMAFDQGGYFLLRVEVRRRPAVSSRQQIHRRHLGRGVDPAQVSGKAPNNGKPSGCPASVGLCGQDRPGKGRLGGQVVLATIFDVGEELSEELLGSNKLVAEDTTHGQIVGKGLAERAHATSPGQGRAIARKASWLTLA